MPSTAWVFSEGHRSFAISIPDGGITARRLRALIEASASGGDMRFIAASYGVFRATAEGTKDGDDELADLYLITPTAGEVNVWVERVVEPAAAPAPGPAAGGGAAPDSGAEGGAAGCTAAKRAKVSHDQSAAYIRGLSPALVPRTSEELLAELRRPLPPIQVTSDILLHPDVQASFNIVDQTADSNMLRLELLLSGVFSMEAATAMYSEEDYATKAYICTGDLWERLDGISGKVLNLLSARNRKDMSGMTIGSLRPDYCLWVKRALLFKAEHKGEADQLPAAERELVDKMQEWSILTMHGLPLLPCYALGGALLQLCAMFPPAAGAAPATPVLRRVGPILDLNVPLGRMAACKMAINMFRVLLALSDLVPDNVLKLYHTVPRGEGESITIEPWGVIKVCRRAAPDAVYTLLGLGGGEPLPCAIQVVGKRQLDSGLFKLRCKPLALQVLPRNEHELRSAVLDVLTSLHRLHAAGFVHRDVRWPNVLQCATGRWLLVDFELAAAAGAAVPPGALHIDFLPPESRAVGAAYSTAGDMYRVGCLVTDWQRAHPEVALSAAALALVARLMTSVFADRPTAAAALGDVWFTAAG